MKGIELLDALTQLQGVSGREKPVAEFIKEQMAPYADEVKIDRLGSCIVYRKGTGEKKQKFMAAAHIDQIGFCVLGADSRGFLRVRPSGTIFTDNIMSNRIVFQNGCKGVVTAYKNTSLEKAHGPQGNAAHLLTLKHLQQRQRLDGAPLGQRLPENSRTWGRFRTASNTALRKTQHFQPLQTASL